ncbi:MAG: hypothetical protein ACKN9T_05685 [Candidatus Methylumidiphilus sp.]
MAKFHLVLMRAITLTCHAFVCIRHKNSLIDLVFMHSQMLLMISARMCGQIVIYETTTCAGFMAASAVQLKVSQARCFAAYDCGAMPNGLGGTPVVNCAAPQKVTQPRHSFV